MKLKLFLLTFISAVTAECTPETEVSLDMAVEKLTVTDYEVESVNRFASKTPVSMLYLLVETDFLPYFGKLWNILQDKLLSYLGFSLIHFVINRVTSLFWEAIQPTLS